MGNYILSGKGPVRIDRRHHVAAHAALLAAHAAISGSIVRGEVVGTRDLVSALGELHWIANQDADGNIVSIDLQYDLKDTWMHTWEEVFDALAPFIVAGSYLQLYDEGHGQDFVHFWKFDGNELLYGSSVHKEAIESAGSDLGNGNLCRFTSGTIIPASDCPQCLLSWQGDRAACPKCGAPVIHLRSTGGIILPEHAEFVRHYNDEMERLIRDTLNPLFSWNLLREPPIEVRAGHQAWTDVTSGRLRFLVLPGDLRRGSVCSRCRIHFEHSHEKCLRCGADLIQTERFPATSAVYVESYNRTVQEYLCSHVDPAFEWAAFPGLGRAEEGELVARDQLADGRLVELCSSETGHRNTCPSCLASFNFYEYDERCRDCGHRFIKPQGDLWPAGDAYATAYNMAVERHVRATLNPEFQWSRVQPMRLR